MKLPHSVRSIMQLWPILRRRRKPFASQKLRCRICGRPLKRSRRLSAALTQKPARACVKPLTRSTKSLMTRSAVFSAEAVRRFAWRATRSSRRALRCRLSRPASVIRPCGFCRAANRRSRPRRSSLPCLSLTPPPSVCSTKSTPRSMKQIRDDSRVFAPK